MIALYSRPDQGTGDGLLTGFVAANLSALLHKRGISQREFGQAIGASESAVSGWLSGKQLPRDRHWPKILEVLKCSMEDVTRNPEMTPKDLDPVVRFLRKQANELGYDLRKLPEKRPD